jgi:hypothetical protein
MTAKLTVAQKKVVDLPKDGWVIHRKCLAPTYHLAKDGQRDQKLSKSTLEALKDAGLVIKIKEGQLVSYHLAK